MNDSDFLQQQVAVGEAARELAHNKAFDLLMQGFEADKQDAVKKLLVVDPEDTKAVRSLQTTIYRYDEIASRLFALIQGGDIAQREILGDLDDEILAQEL